MRLATVSQIPVRAATATYDIGAITRRMGVDRRSRPWQVRYLTRLIAERGFPKPLPTMYGAAVTDEIKPTWSRWVREAVDAWFDGQLPPSALAAISAAERAEVDAKIAGRLEAMGSVG